MIKKETAGERFKRLAFPAPQSIEEAGEFLKKMREAEQQVKAAQIKLDQKVAALKDEAKEKIKPHQDVIRQCFESIFIFAQGHRKELTKEGKIKTIKILPDTFGWRDTPEKVVIDDEEAVIDACQKMGLSQFLRPKVEINKEAMHENKELAFKVPGVSFEYHEEFFVRLAEAEFEMAKETEKLLKKQTIKKMMGS